MSKGGWTIRTNPNKLKRELDSLDKEEIIEFTIVLWKKYLNQDVLDYTKLPNSVVGLLALTIGVSYNNFHPTEESRKKESYEEWHYKLAKTILKGGK